MSSAPGLGRSPRGGHGNLIQYSYLGKPRNSAAWWNKIHGVTESDRTEAIYLTACTSLPTVWFKFLLLWSINSKELHKVWTTVLALKSRNHYANNKCTLPLVTNHVTGFKICWWSVTVHLFLAHTQTTKHLVVLFPYLSDVLGDTTPPSGCLPLSQILHKIGQRQKCSKVKGDEVRHRPSV